MNRLIEGGRARVGITIPPTYDTNLASGQRAEVSVLEAAGMKLIHLRPVTPTLEDVFMQLLEQ